MKCYITTIINIRGYSKFLCNIVSLYCFNITARIFFFSYNKNNIIKFKKWFLMLEKIRSTMQQIRRKLTPEKIHQFVTEVKDTAL